MRAIAPLFLGLALLGAVPVAAKLDQIAPVGSSAAGSRLSAPAAAAQPTIASYGPFQVLDERTAALSGATDARSEAQFAAMLRYHPHIATLRFLNCPGTYDDRANLRLGRMIRAAGLAVHVPAGGSVRSGAVDLVLAGTSLTIADNARFAVHAWEDEDGVPAAAYRADAPEHQKYLAYYREMGMSGEEAAAFYAMTSAASYDHALWLDGAQMRRWVQAQPDDAPRLAYLDSGAQLN